MSTARVIFTAKLLMQWFSYLDKIVTGAELGLDKNLKKKIKKKKKKKNCDIHLIGSICLTVHKEPHALPSPTPSLLTPQRYPRAGRRLPLVSDRVSASDITVLRAPGVIQTGAGTDYLVYLG